MLPQPPIETCGNGVGLIVGVGVLVLVGVIVGVVVESDRAESVLAGLAVAGVGVCRPGGTGASTLGESVARGVGDGGVAHAASTSAAPAAATSRVFLIVPNISKIY